jgi:hypothetical protein
MTVIRALHVYINYVMCIIIAVLTETANILLSNTILNVLMMQIHEKLMNTQIKKKKNNTFWTKKYKILTTKIKGYLQYSFCT